MKILLSLLISILFAGQVFAKEPLSASEEMQTEEFTTLLEIDIHQATFVGILQSLAGVLVYDSPEGTCIVEKVITEISTNDVEIRIMTEIIAFGKACRPVQDYIEETRRLIRYIPAVVEEVDDFQFL